MIRAGITWPVAMLCAGLALPQAALAADPPNELRGVRIWPAPDHTRIVFDVADTPDYRITLLRDPPRLAVDFIHARLSQVLLAAPEPQVRPAGPAVASLRFVSPSPDTVRTEIALQEEVRHRSFTLKPYGGYGHRLVLDLARQPPPEMTRPGGALTAATAASAQGAIPSAGVVGARRPLVVAIDAGHGGEDPGALGRRYRTREKHVVLAIARELYRLTAKTPGLRAVLIRNGDYYVGLRERVRKAQRAGADVFISIHADSVPGRRQRARGASVYALSERGATSALAKALADDENAADWVGGADVGDLEDDVSRLLGALTKEATLNDSLTLGAMMLTALRSAGPLHHDDVSQAGFMVLKSPIPSILIETGFISNPDDEKKLRDPKWQKRMARAIHAGLKRVTPRLLARRRLDETVAEARPASGVAQNPLRDHVVQSGETVAGIARHYRVSEPLLRFLNELPESEPEPGRRLSVPVIEAGVPQ